jgi:hypothetical protein
MLKVTATTDSQKLLKTTGKPCTQKSITVLSISGLVDYERTRLPLLITGLAVVILSVLNIVVWL